MIPDRVGSAGTPGERAIFRFLERAARPDTRHLVWFRPLVGTREPDFVLLSPEIGILVVEVKDWRLGEILSADDRTVRIRTKRGSVERQNPIRQVRDHVFEIRDRLGSARGAARGRTPPKVPVRWALAFPYIAKRRFVEKGLPKVLCGPERIFFGDDLREEGPLLADPSGGAFRRALAERFHPPAGFELDNDGIEWVRGAVFPEIRLADPREEGGPGYDERRALLRQLDRYQENVARDLSRGHKLITGPPGSGKTIVLACRAALLHRAGAFQPMLVLCYNAALVGYLERLLSERAVPVGRGGAEVLPFFELCGKLLGEAIEHDQHDEGYFDTVTRLAIEAAGAEGAPRYRAIFVDEGQDFSSEMLRLVTTLLDPESNELAIAVDPAQDLYRRRFPWASAGVRIRGRVRRLKAVYRNTREIVALAARIAGDSPPGPIAQRALPGLFADTGPAPAVRACEGAEEVAAALAREVREALERERRPLPEFAILYTHRTGPGGDPPCFPLLLVEALREEGLLGRWVTEDYRAKRNYDITTERVTVSTIHSAKGLDFEWVGLAGLEWLDGDLSRRPVRDLVYTAVTRARRRLVLAYGERSRLIDQLLALWDGPAAGRQRSGLR